MSEDKAAMTDAVLAAAVEAKGKKRLACADAFRIASEFGVAPIEIGRICNQQGIKLTGCQLGCF